MKINTSDLVGYVMERHRQNVKSLRAKPALGIIVTGDEASSASFIRAKQRYASDIGVILQVQTVDSKVALAQQIKQWNDQSDITGIVVQLPLPVGFEAEVAINQITASKDVDGLRANSEYEAATAKAIMWILGTQNITIKDSTICVVGQGRLVGKPVSDMLESSGAKVLRCDINTKDLAAQTAKADIVISGVGEPGLIKRSMLADGTIVIDAGTAEAAGKLLGDVDTELYDDPNVKITPVPGGVGPVTVAALFDNLLIATQRQA